MALKPLRPCRHPGCPELTREGYCPAHKPAKAPRRSSAQWHGWYSLDVWRSDLRPTGNGGKPAGILSATVGSFGRPCASASGAWQSARRAGTRPGVKVFRGKKRNTAGLPR